MSFLRCLPRRGLVGAITALRSNELRISQSLSNDTGHSLNEPASVIVFSLVKPKRLLIQIPKQMKRLDVHISPFDAAFEQAPEVFQTVSVNVAFRVALRMIYDIVNVFIRQ